MKPQIWRRLRQISQILALLLFLYLFVYATFLDPQRAWADLFYRLDPLVALTASLAGRAWIPDLSLALLTVLTTLVFGRVWCGWFCPFGTLLEWFTPRRVQRQSRRKAPAPAWRSVKYVLLIILVVAALLGNQSLLFLDPLTMMTRTFAVAIWPAVRVAVYGAESFLYQFDVLWGPLDLLRSAVIYPIFRDVISVFTLSLPILLLFAGVVALNWVAERFWCRYLCPLGALLGLISKFALLRRHVGEGCAACALCSGACPTDTIDPHDGYRSDPAECIVCYDCIVDCTREGVAFRWRLPRILQLSDDVQVWRPAAWHDYDPRRREVLAGAAAAVVGVSLAGVEPITQRTPAHLVRPPGATRTDFEALCVRCGECMRVCPTQGLQPILFEGGLQNALTPRLVSRLGYCDYSCNACGEVCPTGAIPRLSLAMKRATPIGLARVDRDRCLPWAYNIPCIVCEEVCPVSHKAIWLHAIETTNARGEAITLQQPYVVKELCIGCGICEYQCPMGGEAAIRVFAPTEVGDFFGDDLNYRPRRGLRLGGGGNH